MFNKVLSAVIQSHNEYSSLQAYYTTIIESSYANLSLILGEYVVLTVQLQIAGDWNHEGVVEQLSEEAVKKLMSYGIQNIAV